MLRLLLFLIFPLQKFRWLTLLSSHPRKGGESAIFAPKRQKRVGNSTKNYSIATKIKFVNANKFKKMCQFYNKYLTLL